MSIPYKGAEHMAKSLHIVLMMKPNFARDPDCLKALTEILLAAEKHGAEMALKKTEK